MQRPTSSWSSSTDAGTDDGCGHSMNGWESAGGSVGRLEGGVVSMRDVTTDGRL